ncbi:MAG: dihydroorotate dehydrogenase [Acidaminobacteraceae bacterium]
MNLKVNLNGLVLDNPVTVASGTFGFGREYSEYVDLNDIGAISVKGITLKARVGNKEPRIAETNMGILNSVGLQNPGVEAFIEREIPFLRGYKSKIIANVNGSNIGDYEKMIIKLDEEDIDSFEVNISCPNVKQGGMAFGTDPRVAAQLVKSVRKLTKKHIIVKLSPNVKDITEIAKAVEEAGADAISLINTVAGMKIDINTRKPILGNISGGLSGPAVKPIAIKMVYDCYKAVSIPIIGMGGIENYKDAIEFIIAGASAISIGTANFTNPYVTKEVLEGIKGYMNQNNIKDIKELIGLTHRI